MQEPAERTRVRIWPMPGLQVQDGANMFGRWLEPDGREVIWDEHWHRRLRDGSISLHDPRPLLCDDCKVAHASACDPDDLAAAKSAVAAPAPAGPVTASPPAPAPRSEG